MEKSTITFKNCSDLQRFCKLTNLKPIIYINAKKHSNMRGEFFHEIYGEIDIEDLLLDFTVDEYLILNNKLPKSNEYTLKDLI